MSLYVKFGRKETLGDFLDQFFQKWPNFSFITGAATYSDKECNNLQTREGRYRSFDDILELVNTYYDDIRPKELMHELVMLNKGSMYTLFCSGIRKSVMLYTTMNPIICKTTEKGYSQYSWKELFGLLDIKDVNSYNNYKYLQK